MANRLTTNPMVIDTAATLAGPLVIKRMMWVGTAAANKDIAAADVLTLKNVTKGVVGGVIYEQKPTAGELGPFVIFDGSDSWVLQGGLDVTTIDGGELFIWV